MFKLKKILLEVDVKADRNRFSKDESDAILTYLKNAYVLPNQLIYRRVGFEYNEMRYDVLKIRKDRQLRDTNEFNNAFSETYLAFYFKDSYIPKRTEILYAYSNEEVDTSYGENLMVIFPKKTCKILYNEKYTDSYTIYNIKFIFLAKAESYIPFVKKYKLPNLHLFVQSYKKYLDIGDLSDTKLFKINFDRLKKEIRAAIKIIDAIYQKKEISKVVTEILEFRILLTSLDEYFYKIDAYISGLKVYKAGQKMPSNIDGFEIVVDGDEYLIANAERFLNTFEWSDVLKTWAIKPFVKKGKE